MPRPRSLTPGTLAGAALKIIDRDGLPLLSMRTLAAELGVSTMSLYRYVNNREELERLVVEAVVETIDVGPSPEGSWRDRIEGLVEGAWRAMRAHPAVVPLVLTRRHNSPSAVRWGEAMLHALADAGFEGSDRAVAFRTLLSYLIGAVQVEHFGPLSGEGTAALAKLPLDRFPYLAATARGALRISPDEEFRGGLGKVLNGLAPAELEGRRPGRMRAGSARKRSTRGG